AAEGEYGCSIRRTENPVGRPMHLRRPAFHGRSHTDGAGFLRCVKQRIQGSLESWSIGVKLGRCHKGSEINIQYHTKVKLISAVNSPGSLAKRLFLCYTRVCLKNPRRRGMMGLFDIIGPVMIGPSSSHTAGAARLGRLVRRLAGQEIKEAVLHLHG